MATVIFKRETDYDVGKIYDSLVEMIEIGGLSDKIKYGERILLKPNLLAARTPDSAVTTHPAVVEAVAKIVLDYSAIPIIGDSPGGAIRGTQRVLKNTGMLKISEKLGIETISLEAKSAIQIKLPDGKILHISKIINEVDGIINNRKIENHIRNDYDNSTFIVDSIFWRTYSEHIIDNNPNLRLNRRYDVLGNRNTLHYRGEKNI